MAFRSPSTPRNCVTPFSGRISANMPVALFTPPKLGSLSPAQAAPSPVRHTRCLLDRGTAPRSSLFLSPAFGMIVTRGVLAWFLLKQMCHVPTHFSRFAAFTAQEICQGLLALVPGRARGRILCHHACISSKALFAKQIKTSFLASPASFLNILLEVFSTIFFLPKYFAKPFERSCYVNVLFCCAINNICGTGRLLGTLVHSSLRSHMVYCAVGRQTSSTGT